MTASKQSLSSYLNSLPSKEEKENFAKRCKTSLGYLRLITSGVRQCSATLAIDIDRESEGKVACEELCPNADFAYLRNSKDEVA